MNKLGRERVTVEELAAWLCWRLGGIVSGHEVLYEEGADEVTLSFRCAGGGGFVQERVCSRGWMELSPRQQKADADRLFFGVKGRVEDARRRSGVAGAGPGIKSA